MRIARVGVVLFFAACAGGVIGQPAWAADEAKPAAAAGTSTTPKRSKAELEAMLTKCSDEADAKGLSVARGKGAERKAFRRECMRKMGVSPR